MTSRLDTLMMEAVFIVAIRSCFEHNDFSVSCFYRMQMREDTFDKFSASYHASKSWCALSYNICTNSNDSSSVCFDNFFNARLHDSEV